VNNYSLTSKRVPKIPQAFLQVALLGFPSIREKEKGLEPQFYYLQERGNSLSLDIISQIPTVFIFQNELRR